jgi:predicted small metal-binding protein
MVLRCDCGFRVAAACEADLLAGAEAHAREAHGTDIGSEEVRDLLRSRPDGLATEGEDESP